MQTPLEQRSLGINVFDWWVECSYAIQIYGTHGGNTEPQVVLLRASDLEFNGPHKYRTEIDPFQ